MIPLSAATSSRLTWSKISSRNFELNRNGEVIGTLQRPSFWSSSFVAETQSGRWTFRRGGWLGAGAQIVDSSQQHVATFKSGWGGGGGTLSFADGQTVHLQSKGWCRPVWSVIAETGETLLCLHRREKIVDVPSTSAVPEGRLALLIVFTWYRVLQSEEDAASVAVMAAS